MSLYKIPSFWQGRCLPDDTVCALADYILNLILIGHVEGDLAGSSLCGVLLNHPVGSVGLGSMVSSSGRAKSPGWGTGEREAFHDAGE